MKHLRKYSLLTALIGLLINSAIAQNPLITNQFTADPSARVFGDKVYIYPSHDIKATPGHGRAGWFNMADYHVFSSSNLTDWTDHGVIVSQNKVAWVDSNAYAMWAPDCIERNGKYYFYFPAPFKAGLGRGNAVGVAIADKPYGPFVPEPMPIKGVLGIDPNVFMDKDGQAYLYWAQGNIFGAKLKDNMLELASDVKVIWATREEEFFCGWGWTEIAGNSPSGKSASSGASALRRSEISQASLDPVLLDPNCNFF